MRSHVTRWTLLVPSCFLVVTLASYNSFAHEPKSKVPSPFAFEQKTKDEAGNLSPGKVTFDHNTHKEKDQKCTYCHGKDKPFKTKIGTSPDVTMKAMDEGKACGTCHNGKASFPTRGKESCTRCHGKGA
jgi:c(7)-type cytochrome triheme protein